MKEIVVVVGANFVSYLCEDEEIANFISTIKSVESGMIEFQNAYSHVLFRSEAFTGLYVRSVTNLAERTTKAIEKLVNGEAPGEEWKKSE